MNKPWQRPALAALWALIVLMLAATLVVLLARGTLRINTDVLAMLPRDERSPAVEQAVQALAQAGEGRVVVLLRAESNEASRRATDAFAAELQRQLPTLQIRHRVADEGAWLSAFLNQRGRLLSDAQRQQLQSASAEALAQGALAQLMQPMGLPRLGPWQDDPLATLPNWLAERAQASRVRTQDGRLMLPGDEQGDWALLMLQSSGSAFALAANEQLVAALTQAEAAARAQAPQLQLVKAGVPLFAEAAARTAQNEMHAIGLGSVLGVFLLSWWAFGRVKPRLLVLLSVGTGLLAAVVGTQAIFGELHLITLVFGASLVGVAENYASSYYAASIGRSPAERWQVMAEQAGTMGLALSTTLAGYLLLAVTPFPGLRQVALFSALGLGAAYLSTLLWFPWLDAATVPARPFTECLGRLWARWPQPSLRTRAGFAGLALLLGAAALWLGRANDDIRLLQSAPPHLVADQRAVSELLELPSPAQFFLLEAASDEALLQAEEALKAGLAPLLAQGRLKGWQAVSDWLPSQARQTADAELLQRRWRELAPLLSEALGQPVPAALSVGELLTPETGLQSPAAEAVRHQWLGVWAAKTQARAGASCGTNLGADEALDRPQQRVGNDEWPRKSPRPAGLSSERGRSVVAPLARAASPGCAARLVSDPFRAQRGPEFLPPTLLGQQRSVVMLRGVARDDAALQALSGPGLRYVNKVSEVSALLARYRVFMLGVLAVAVAAVYLLLHWRFGRPAWRALAPTLLAGALTLALLAVAGQALQLFHVLALLLLLGVGVDYGIFLLAQPNRRDGRSFVSVTLAAASTLLAFGLLALSGTPALRAFGLTLGLGILLAWALTPFFIPNPERTAP